MLRRFATGQGLTPDLFMQSAMEQPLSPLATLGESVTTGVLSSPGIGTAIRELYAPDAARKVVTEDLGPASLGRGGTGRRTRTRLGFKTAEEVAAEGDTLFTTPEAFKASPFYREAIPFEPGMTESRARALADMYDAQQVRDYYGQKRPVLNFVGNVAGSALDPINYIPIVGEAAYAAAAYRIGRIGARAVIGAADAAANTALFGILTADQRAKFGDDVSWNAIAMNAAYAAVAGGVVGAGIGTGAHFFRRSADAPLPEIPEAARTDGVAAPVLPERPAPDLTMGDRVTARFDTEPRATVNVFDRMETAGNRIKAADVMNDAIRGIVDEGEVRLGERSQGHVAAMQADAARIEARVAANDSLARVREEWDRAGVSNSVSENNGVITVSKIIVPKDERGKGIGSAAMARLTEYADATGQRIALSPSADFGGSKPRLEKFYKAMGFLPNKGRSRDLSVSETMIREPKQRTSAVASPRNPVLNAVTEEVVPVDRPAADIAPRSLRADALKGPRINTKTNFTVPAPDPVAPMLKPALAKVEARATVSADPEKALIDRIVSDAKEEGFDPETGSHDLEAEIEAMRAQGVLTPDEDAAIRATDETYQAATAWEDVMTVARNCVLPS